MVVEAKVVGVDRTRSVSTVQYILEPGAVRLGRGPGAVSWE